MKSTSVYWIPVYQILEARGLEVYLVNAQHVKNVSGRKTDVSDYQWLQYLHSAVCYMPASSLLDSYAPYGLSGDIAAA
jgi:transposase